MGVLLQVSERSEQELDNIFIGRFLMDCFLGFDCPECGNEDVVPHDKSLRNVNGHIDYDRYCPECQEEWHPFEKK